MKGRSKSKQSATLEQDDQIDENLQKAKAMISKQINKYENSLGWMSSNCLFKAIFSRTISTKEAKRDALKDMEKATNYDDLLKRTRHHTGVAKVRISKDYFKIQTFNNNHELNKYKQFKGEEIAQNRSKVMRTFWSSKMSDLVSNIIYEQFPKPKNKMS